MSNPNMTIYIVKIKEIVLSKDSNPKEEILYFRNELSANMYVDGFNAAGSKFYEISLEEESTYD